LHKWSSPFWSFLPFTQDLRRSLFGLAGGLLCGLYYDRQRTRGILADYNQLKARFNEQASTIRSLEKQQQIDRGTITELRKDRDRFKSAYNQLRELSQSEGDIISAIESGEREHSKRLDRLEELVRGMRKKD